MILSLNIALGILCIGYVIFDSLRVHREAYAQFTKPVRFYTSRTYSSFTPKVVSLSGQTFDLNRMIAEQKFKVMEIDGQGNVFVDHKKFGTIAS